MGAERKGALVRLVLDELKSGYDKVNAQLKSDS